MAVSYTSPTNSFVQFTEPDRDCAWVTRPCLPVFELEDLQFQIFASVDGADKATFLNQLISASVVTNCDEVVFFFRSFSANWQLLSTGAYSDPDLYVGYFSQNTNDGFTQYPVGTCFHLKLYKEYNGDPIECMETCLTKIGDECYTSIVAYRGESNMFGFNYMSPNYNRVRLPLYCHSPLAAEDKTEYAKSDGSTVLLSYRLWKDYKVKTDYLPDFVHDRLIVALSHSDLRITDIYSGLNQSAVVRTEKMDLNWIEADTPGWNMAQGSTTVRFAAPQENVNSNCG